MRKFKLLYCIALSILLFSCQKENNSDYLKESPDQLNTLDNVNVEAAFPNSEGQLKKITDEITIKKVGEYNVWSGDILLTNDQIATLKISFTKGTALSSLAKRWPSCNIYYEIDSSLPNSQRVYDAISHWEANTPTLSFVERTTQTNYIDFVPGSGCSSYLGKIGGRQEIILASGCSTGNTIHEIGHALGLFHEQARSDRDDFININWANIETGREHNFQTYTQRGIGGFETGTFDFSSIMMYSPYAFTENGQPTITRLDGSLYNVQRNALSTGDINIIQGMYNCPIITTYISGPNKAGNYGTYTWSANVNGGTAPYTYNWYYNYDGSSDYPTPWGTGQSVTASMPLDKNLGIKVVVTDSDGNQATATRFILNTDANGGGGPRKP